MSQADFVHEITREGILARLEGLILDPRRILDLGSAGGASGRLFGKRFKRAHVVALDLDKTALAEARKQRPWFAKSSFVRADAGRLPFADEQFDVIVANQLLPWIEDPAILYGEVARVLRKGGLFTFATLGPNSRIFAQLADMHDVGDGLVRAGLKDPVLDIDRLTVNYDDTDRLRQDLQGLGPFDGGKNATPETGLSLELELVYGHCWGNGRPNEPGVMRFDANQIPLRR